MRFLSTLFETVFLCWFCKLASSQTNKIISKHEAWNWEDYKVDRQNVRPSDPWAVDRCPESIFNDTYSLEFPEDCTRYQTCSWSADNKTINVKILDCFNCNPPACPEGKMIYYDGDKKCHPPNQLLPSENRCGTKDSKREECSGPPNGILFVHRLANSRFYVYHDPGKQNWVDWHGAHEVCSKLGLKLAKIDNIQTEVYVGRQLENIVYTNRWDDNWYWLDAKFDPKQHTYVWQDTNETIKFSNFYYLSPRPKGYGGEFDSQGNYNTKVTKDYCIALSLPLPISKSDKGLVPYAFHTSWGERICETKNRGNVLCESVDPACDERNATDSRSATTIAFSTYYYQEFLPMSNRRFVVFWGAKSFEDAKVLCASNNMKILSPRDGDTCLITDLKRWNIEVTSYSFWTDMRYQVAERTFVYPNGTEDSLRFQNMTARTRSSTAHETCVSYTWNSDKYPENPCNANSLVLSPENCFNPIGVICQHPELEASESIKCDEGYLDTVPKKTWFPFDSKRLGLIRSGYKQPGHDGTCPHGYTRVTINDTYWKPEEGYDFEKSSYKYDFLSSYWILPVNRTCYLSQVTYDYDRHEFTRVLTSGDCNKWLGFILCKIKTLQAGMKTSVKEKTSEMVESEYEELELRSLAKSRKVRNAEQKSTTEAESIEWSQETMSQTSDETSSEEKKMLVKSTTVKNVKPTSTTEAESIEWSGETVVHTSDETSFEKAKVPKAKNVTKTESTTQAVITTTESEETSYETSSEEARGLVPTVVKNVEQESTTPAVTSEETSYETSSEEARGLVPMVVNNVKPESTTPAVTSMAGSDETSYETSEEEARVLVPKVVKILEPESASQAVTSITETLVKPSSEALTNNFSENEVDASSNTENLTIHEEYDLWNWENYKINRQYVRPDDPWAVDRCPEFIFNGTTSLPFPEDCTRYQTCSWSPDENTINVRIPECFKCNPPACPEGKMIYYDNDKKCYPPNQLLPTENKCGTKVPPKKECSGPANGTQYVSRLGDSRFYIFNDPTGTNFVNWYEAQEKCKKLGLKLAKIDNLQTEVYVGRQLETFLYTKRWKDNWYWLDAKFDPKLQIYVWQDTKQPLKFSNFYFRPPRPKGYGGFFDAKGMYVTQPKEDHCLAQSLPLPFPKSDKKSVPYGFHTGWWERLCGSKKKGNILCESTDPVCDERNATDSRSTTTIAFSAYYYQEFWPISNRRFVVYWGARNFKEAEALCKANNLKIYSPRDGDTCLITDLKRWNLEVTSYSFWTDIRYVVSKEAFLYTNGTEVPLRFQNITTKTRSSVIIDTCVSYTWNYEKYPANLNFCHCKANSLVLSPENCLNPIGVICQHPDFEKTESMKCDEGYFDAVPEKTWFPFDSKKLGLMRSGYKQPGNGGACPDGYTRVTVNDTYWKPEEGYDFEKSSYQYDFLASYWMLPIDSTCYLSQVAYDSNQKSFVRTLKIGNCNKWLGFILCKSTVQNTNSTIEIVGKDKTSVNGLAEAAQETDSVTDKPPEKVDSESEEARVLKPGKPPGSKSESTTQANTSIVSVTDTSTATSVDTETMNDNLTESEVKEHDAWNWENYKVNRQYVRPNDPLAVDRCPESFFNGTITLEFPEDCTRYQTCTWSKEMDTIDVHIPECFKCNLTECPEGKMVYHQRDKKCFPPNQLLPSENKCGTKVPPKEKCSGPPNGTKFIYRLSNSRFFVYQDLAKQNWVDWYEAQKICEKLGLKLAKIDNIQTEVYVGRQLEKFIHSKRWGHSWYWLDAKFDPKLQTYVWQDTKKAIQFSNFYYLAPRPKGYGGFFDSKANFLAKSPRAACIAMSLPLPFPKSEKGLVPYPFQTSWMERLCDMNTKGSALCESVDPVCDERNASDSRLIERIAFSDYYYQEFRPLSNRRFVVSWGAKSFQAAKDLCMKHNLKLYSPRDGDSCLITELKSWNLEVTSYSFWTDVKYQINEQAYVYPDGKAVPIRFRNMTVKTRSTMKKETCVSYTWNYEIYPENINFCNCSANSLVMSPENCKNPIGVICQHPDVEGSETMKCEEGNPNDNFKKSWYPFESTKMGLIRSTYKQPGNGGSCPSGYKRVTIEDTYWITEEGYDFETSSYQYDYLSSYWMLPVDSTCYLSQVSYNSTQKSFSRILKTGNCNKWLGFILCKSKDQNTNTTIGIVGNDTMSENGLEEVEQDQDADSDAVNSESKVENKNTIAQRPSLAIPPSAPPASVPPFAIHSPPSYSPSRFSSPSFSKPGFSPPSFSPPVNFPT